MAIAHRGRSPIAPALTVRRAPSLRRWFVALVGVLAAALLTLGATALWQAHDAARVRLAEQMLGTARAMALLVDQEFARAEAVLRALAAHPGVAEGDVAAFVGMAGRLGRSLDGMVLALAETPGLQLANSVEGALATPRSMPGGLDDVFRTGLPVISDLYAGTLSGRPIVSLALPLGPAGGTPRFAIGLALAGGQLSSVLARHRLPEGAVAVVLDRRDVIAARTQRETETVGQPATAELTAVISGAAEGIVPSIVNLDGEAATVVFARAPVSRYTVGIAIPRAVLLRERNMALGRLALFAVPVAGGALLVALLLGLRLRTALARLPAGEAGPRLAEVEELGRALAEAEAARAAGEVALREKLLAQKDLLVAEMHHRVKNSLQLVQALLLLQARGATGEAARKLREAAGRIVSIAAVHRRLYEGGAEAQQDVADHLGGLLDDLQHSLGLAARQVRLEAMPSVRLPPERMAQLGLLATELVTNAVKHGAGTVTLRLTQDGPAEGGEAVLEVADEGPGFPDGFDPATSRGLGMRVAVAMARQLGGRLDLGPGARVTLRFPVA